MIYRDENGNVTSYDKLSDVTKEISRINDLIQKAVKKPDKVSAEQKAELEKSVGEMKSIVALVTPELQKSGSPIELMGFLKEMVRLKNIAEQVEKLKND